MSDRPDATDAPGLESRTGLRWLALSVLVIAADQLTKWWIVGNLVYRQRIEVTPFLDITRLHNTGAAFSLLADSGGWQRWFFVALAVAVSLFILVWLRRLIIPGQRWLAAALALLLGGALGNVIDRLVYGHVVDFIYVHYEDMYWPAFNVADSAITAGAVMLILDSILQWRREKSVA